MRGLPLESPDGVSVLTATAAPELAKVRAALGYARERHRGQVREVDGAPFIAHPWEVASLLYAAGAATHVVAAGVLHDVIEKTPATAFDLRRRFGTAIATLVLAVSEDEHIYAYTERKSALRRQVGDAGEEALLLFAADKVSKAWELRRERSRWSRPARADGERKLDQYELCLPLLQERLPDSPLVSQLYAELAQLRGVGRRRGVWRSGG